MSTFTLHQAAWSVLAGPPAAAINSYDARSMRNAIAGLAAPTAPPVPRTVHLPTGLTYVSCNPTAKSLTLRLTIATTSTELVWIYSYETSHYRLVQPWDLFHYQAYTAAITHNITIVFTWLPAYAHVLLRTVDKRDGKALGDQHYSFTPDW
jgi:hypothetical protein